MKTPYAAKYYPIPTPPKRFARGMRKTAPITFVITTETIRINEP
jgi:hypothetical protein